MADKPFRAICQVTYRDRLYKPDDPFQADPDDPQIQEWQRGSVIRTDPSPPPKTKKPRGSNAPRYHRRDLLAEQ